MLVQCPNCKTTYKVADDVVKDSTPSFRCSRCKHTFELEAIEIAKQNVLTDSVPDEPVNETEPKFTFPDPAIKSSEAPEQQELPEIPSRPDLPEQARREETNWSMSPAENENDAPFTIQEPALKTDDRRPDPVKSKANESSREPEPKQPAQDPIDNVFSIEPYRDEQASITPFMTLFGLLVIGFSLAAVSYQAHPAASEDLVGRIPLVGSSVVRNDHLKNGVLLKSMEGSYHPIQGNREVFVITGTAVNQNPVIIRKVRLTGRIFNAEGKEIEQETMWVGNALSAKIVRGMTAQDIADLQKLEPLRNFEIPSGDSVPFALVFLKTGQAAKNFACEITAAEASDAT